MRKMLAAALIVVAGVFLLSAPSVIAQPAPCIADLNCDGDVAGEDITLFLSELNKRTGIGGNPCTCVESSCACGPFTCTGTLSPLGRWCDQGNGTVKDMITGLVWLKKMDWGGSKVWSNCTTWDDAHTRVSELSPGVPGAELSDNSGVGDWTLPTSTEFWSLVRDDWLEHLHFEIGNYHLYFFTGNVWTEYVAFWTSQTYATHHHTAIGLLFDLQNGTWHFLNYSKVFDQKYIWPVRRWIPYPE